jgi:hypothetical protein
VNRLVCVVLATALALGACGRKGPPVAPQLVRPLPPESLAAVPSADGVRLTWLRPQHYSGGGRMHDLGGFTIERAPGEGGPFVTVGTMVLEDQTRFRQERRLEWTDRTAEQGGHYLYRVTAFTLDDYRSAPTGPVAVRIGSKSTLPSRP